MTHALSPGRLAEIACILEVSARKPGNVHPEASFADTVFVDFLLSAGAIVGPLDRAREQGVGRTVLEAVEATRLVVSTNTNLGMILLLAPLAAVPATVDLRTGLRAVLDATTVEDARLVYRAIRQARPGGLGKAPEQDVAAEPTVTLLEAMRLASHHDLVARQYDCGYADVFEIALPSLRNGVRFGRPLERAILESYLWCLASLPDSLIARKLGNESAAECSRRAAAVFGSLGLATERAAIAELDAWLRAEGHARNPGATADLMAAALFAALRDGTIALPRPAGPSSWSAF